MVPTEAAPVCQTQRRTTAGTITPALAETTAIAPGTARKLPEAAPPCQTQRRTTAGTITPALAEATATVLGMALMFKKNSTVARGKARAVSTMTTAYLLGRVLQLRSSRRRSFQLP